jgi:hypothetical protein
MRLICVGCLPGTGFKLGENLALPQYVGGCSVCRGMEPCSDVDIAERPMLGASYIDPPPSFKGPMAPPDRTASPSGNGAADNSCRRPVRLSHA